MNIIKSIMTLASLSLVIMFSSCDNIDDIQQKEEPIFPEIYENYDVSPGEIIEISFTPNSDWTVSIPYDSYEFFQILDGTFPYRVKKGKAGAEVTLKVKVTDIEDESDGKYCEVMIEMGGQEEVLAKILMPGKNKSVEVSAGTYSDGMFDMSDGGYLYGEPVTMVELVWTGTDYRMPVKVNSNFSWTVEFPEWLKADIPAVKYGETMFNLYGVPSKLPLEDAEGKIVFLHHGESVYEIAVKIPGCKNVFAYDIGMALTEFVFSSGGYLKTEVGYIESAANVTMFGPEDLKYVVIGAQYGRFVVNSPHWVKITMDEYAKGQDVLQSRNVQVNVDSYSGTEDREAYVFFLPATAGDNLGYAQLFESDMLTLKPEYADYAVKLIQHCPVEEYITPDAELMELALKAVTFKKSADESLKSWSPEAYELTYARTWSQDEGYLHLTEKYSEIRVYRHDRTLVPEEDVASFWCSFDEFDSRMYGRVVVSVDKIPASDAVAYFEFVDDDNSVLGVIKFVYDENCVPELGDISSEVRIALDYMEQAAELGITLTEISEGDELFEKHQDENCPIYHLEFTKDASEVKLVLPPTATCYYPDPYAYRHHIIVNNLDIDDKIGAMTKTDDAVFVKMTMPEDVVAQVNERNEQHKQLNEELEDYVFRGYLRFYNARNALSIATDNISVFVVCTLTLPYQE